MTDLEQLLRASIKIRELEQHVERLKKAANKLMTLAAERVHDMHMAAHFMDDPSLQRDADRWLEACIAGDMALYAQPIAQTEPHEARLMVMPSGRLQ